jgi:multidrug resistance efflux pump
MTEPVSVKRFVQELEKLKQEMDAGRLKHGEYDQRLARMIQELRDRKLDADRAEITAALEEALQRGVITRSVRDHLMKRLGLS